MQSLSRCLSSSWLAQSRQRWGQADHLANHWVNKQVSVRKRYYARSCIGTNMLNSMLLVWSTLAIFPSLSIFPLNICIVTPFFWRCSSYSKATRSIINYYCSKTGINTSYTHIRRQLPWLIIRGTTCFYVRGTWTSLHIMCSYFHTSISLPLQCNVRVLWKSVLLITLATINSGEYYVCYTLVSSSLRGWKPAFLLIN